MDTNSRASPSNSAEPSYSQSGPLLSSKSSTKRDALVQGLKPGVRGPEDGDTCRICRGEGTTEEPLFYPCKCSGSIKFVHQECLMEWLSHSQKKHCELCKTSFRFTKLYDPQMPQSLPTVVFIRKALIHFLKALLTWLRGLLVSGVWLFWLPWSMRFIWWGLLWIGDGDWTHNFEDLRRHGFDVDAVLSSSSISSLQSASPTVASTPANSVPTRSISAFSFSEVGSLCPATVALAKRFYALFPASKSVSGHRLSNSTTISNATTGARQLSSHKSFLSELSFFENLTPNSRLNRFIIDIVEGQLITMCVVTAFVLIFLIREWVVQQQPALNIEIPHDGAALENGLEPPPAAENDPREVPPDETIVDDESTMSVTSDDILIPNREPTLAEIGDLILQLRDAKPSLRGLIRGDMDWNGDADELKHAKQLIVRTRYAYDTLKQASKDALDRESTVEARSALERMELVSEALSLFPWKDEAERVEVLDLWEGYMGAARQLLVCQENRQRERSPSTLISGIGDKAVARAGQNAFSVDVQENENSLGGVDFTEDLVSTAESSTSAINGGSSTSQARPTMPARIRSSLATEIQRDLEESAVPSKLMENPLLSQEESRGHESNGDSGGRSSHNVSASDNRLRLQSPGFLDEDTTPYSASMRSLGLEYPSADHQEERAVVSSSAGPRADISNLNTTDGINESLARESSALDSPTMSDEDHGLSASAMSNSISSAAGQVESEDVHSETEEVENELDQPDSSFANKSVMDRILDWLWGDLIPAEATPDNGANDEHIVQDLAEEAPFVPFVDARPENRAGRELPAPENEDQDQDAGAEHNNGDANQNDGEAAEEAEDIEGVLELIGMQGPLTGLFQNAIFSAVLISATITSAVWFPYLCGKIVLLFVANPIHLAVRLPLRLISSATNFTIDFGLFLLGGVVSWIIEFMRLSFVPIVSVVPSLQRIFHFTTAWKLSRHISDSALARMENLVLATNREASSDHLHLSLSSHIALRSVQSRLKMSLTYATTLCTSFCHYFENLEATARAKGYVGSSFIAAAKLMTDARNVFATHLKAMPRMFRLDYWTFVFNNGAKPLIEELEPANWTTVDRIAAIAAGYTFFAMLGALYLRRGTPFSSSEHGKKVENVIFEILRQSGGVLKVILIISIEMIVFPLYCGFLLDAAMLPLFQSSLQSRVEFTIWSPWTSAFVHWFVGTCYMFHFALFVSMCRKIFRKGVLYFIRDPDDPTFHPVRDVLERSVSSQLKKIGFSAIVYGALVIVCMGSVVWAIPRIIRDVFPLRWISNAPFLGFPIDLLLYNLLAPLALHFLRPSKGLHKIYEWWFRNCARKLQLSNFLFGETQHEPGAKDTSATESNGLQGRYVRAPASDQVRIPKGHGVFLEVDKDNNRLGGLQDEDEGVHGKTNPQFTQVWIPPWYRLRIALFVFFMWALTAFLGLSFTVLPLLVGRAFFYLLTPQDVQVNDIYAFAFGAFPFIAAFYLASWSPQVKTYLKSSFSVHASSFTSALDVTRRFTIRASALFYTYGALTLFLPSLLAALLECYLVMPLHAYMTMNYSSTAPHHIFFLQDWTLGLLYLRIFMRLLLWNPESRPARALHAIVHRGWLQPDVRIATRCFIFPITFIAAVALLVPAGVAYVLGQALPLILSTSTHVFSGPIVEVLRLAGNDLQTLRTDLMVFSYPFVMTLGLLVWAIWGLVKAAFRWRTRIKDEVYLIGERLHNFGERRPPVHARRIGISRIRAA